MKKIVKYIIVDILRNKIVIAYTFFLLAISLGVLNLEDNPTKGLLSLMNVVLFVVPLVSIIFSTIYVYNSSEFIELLISQPLKRKILWLSLFSGLSISLSFAFLIGCGIPLLLFNTSEVAIMMLVIGLIESVIFVAIALFASVKQRDKAKGIGVAIFALGIFFFTF
jgi:Cu-processing system permease protein